MNKMSSVLQYCYIFMNTFLEDVDFLSLLHNVHVHLEFVLNFIKV